MPELFKKTKRWTFLGHSVNSKYCCKSVKNRPRHACLCIFKMAAAAILIFIESWILGHSNSRTENLYPPNKFYTNIFIRDRDMAAEKQNARWPPTADTYCFYEGYQRHKTAFWWKFEMSAGVILDLIFWPYLCIQWTYLRQIWCTHTEILPHNGAAKITLFVKFKTVLIYTNEMPTFICLFIYLLTYLLIDLLIYFRLWPLSLSQSEKISVSFWLAVTQSQVNLNHTERSYRGTWWLAKWHCRRVSWWHLELLTGTSPFYRTHTIRTVISADIDRFVSVSYVKYASRTYEPVKELDSLRWFSQRRSPTPHFRGAHPGRRLPPNSNSAEIFVQCTYRPSFIILCLLGRSYRVDKQTNILTHTQTNRRRWKYPTLFATLRRW